MTDIVVKVILDREYSIRMEARHFMSLVWQDAWFGV